MSDVLMSAPGCQERKGETGRRDSGSSVTFRDAELPAVQRPRSVGVQVSQVL
jgi:hypothetical protein